jgi:hypothetical protein
MWHPFLGWESQSLGWLLALLSVSSLVLFLRLESLGRTLRNTAAPLGMASLAMSLSASHSRAILSSWQEAGREAARRHLLVDYCLVPVFSTTLAVLGLFAARWFELRGQLIMRDAAMVITWGAWLAGALDFAENTTLLRMVHAYPVVPEALTRLTGWLTRCKYLLILLTFGVCGFAVVSMWMG